MEPENDRAEELGWPQSFFSHIEPGNNHPRIGKIFGYAGLMTGILPAMFLAFQACYSILIKQILDPGMAILGSVVWTGFAMGIAAMFYKFAHEFGGKLASKNALIGFGLAPMAILIAFAYNFIAAWLGLERMMR